MKYVTEKLTKNLLCKTGGEGEELNALYRRFTLAIP